MSYSNQQYNSNNDGIISQTIDTALLNGNNVNDIFRSFYGIANNMMDDLIRNGANADGMTAFRSMKSNNPNVKIFGISSLNITSISRGPDGKPHIVQAHDERRMGPGGVWQTKKALRDPKRGIDKMQVGYFTGDHGEIIERTLDQASGQYRQERKPRGVASNDQNFTNQWRIQAQQAMQRPSHSQQQQIPYNDQHSQPASAHPSHSERSSQANSYYNQYPQQPPSVAGSHQYY
ncbi:unnamed protein product [Adineta steineri]|uniref:Uncharacterized protein n=1 Tax=Adineta steineri TaxID=433720 RepID=A0A814ZJK1_9BILA|nr:unnamed protein product [Adineta steineri]CAF1242722.1 unnamed protein product [Adineta steineri]